MLAEDPIPDKIVGLEVRGVIRGDGARQRAARERLDAVIRDHPDTPWGRTAALLKERLYGFSLREVNYGGGAPKNRFCYCPILHTWN